MKRIAIEPPGADRDLLFFPGNDLAAEFYQGVADCLGRHGFRTTLLTLPGFYGEPALPEPGWGPMMEALMAEVDRALPNGGVLVGHSLGGLMALLAAAKRPERVTHLVLMEPAIPPGKLMAEAAARRYRRQVVDADRGTFTNWSGSFHRIRDEARFPQEMIELYLRIRKTSDPTVSRTLVETLPELYPLPFAQIRSPVLLLYGASCGWVNRLGLLYLSARLRMKRKVIEGAGHWMANEQDEAIAEAVTSFAR